MCVGLPMQVVSGDDVAAVCERRGERATINMMLVGAQPPGTWVLTFMGAAREVLSGADAAQIDAALDAVAAALAGNTDVDHYFSDLAGREPQLPEHLRRK
ncbi:MAG TPA: HypC/HybG/HupF family hydrogenase formation chaperone [Pelomicrobium sp.]|nr:HypC/HybG/HupF family hydrogenase formation chaperone [Pelomicrobium sp.]